MSSDSDASDITRRLAYTAKTDLAQMKDYVVDSTKKLGAMASNFFAEWNDRY